MPLPQALFLSLVFLVPSAPAMEIICKDVLPRLLLNSSPRGALPIQSFKIPGLKIEGVPNGEAWLHQYADNLWGISGENDSLDRLAQSILLGNNPTPHRSDILYIFAHGFREVPLFGTKTKGGALFAPSDLMEKIKQLGHDPASRMKAVVLLSCHSGSQEGKVDSTFFSASTYVSAATGLPVIAPTGALVMQFSDSDKGYTVQGFYQQEVEPGTTGWSIVTASQSGGVPIRQDVLSLKEMREISGFYKKWDAYTRRVLPNHPEAAQIE
jgi:hypothetical protein